MYANKNKTKNSKARTVATSADSTKLSSTDSRYDAGDYEAVPASIRKARDARNKALEEQNAIPAEEIIARQEAEIAELKRQAAAGSAPKTMADKYRSAVDDLEDHPTFKNPDSMADFGDYEAVASTARFAAAGRDPNQKVFRAKPSVSTRKVASPSDLSPGDYEAVAAAARHAVPPDEFVPDTPSDEEVPEYTASAPAPAPSPASAPAPARASSNDDVIHSEPYTPPKAPKAAPSDDVIHSEPYTPPRAAAPAPEPVSAADYTVQNYSAPAAAPAPGPVSASDYMVSNYTTPAPAPAAKTEPAPEPASSYSGQTYVPPAQRSEYSTDGNYDVGGGPVYSPTSGRRIASVVDIAPGDYEAVAASTYDDSDMDLADGSYDFDKYLAGAPSLQMQAAPAPSPEESDWADLGTDSQSSDDIDITDEQTRALTEAIAQETLTNQPGTQFEDIIDNVIAKVLERKKAEEAAKAAKQQEQPEQQKPAEPEQTQPKQEQPEQPAQKPAAPEQPEQVQPEQAEQKAAPEQPEEPQPAPDEAKRGLTPGVIDSSTPIEDIPALILAELDSAEGEVSDDDIKKSIDEALIGKLTTGELTLDSVQIIRGKILDEIHEMQEEEARILAQLEGKPEKHPFDPDFLSADIAVEDIPDAVIAELDNIEGEVSDEEVKQSIDKVMIAKLAKGELTLDSFQEARDSIFDTLGIETAEEQAEEPAEEQVEEQEPEPVEKAEPVEEQEPEPVEETEPVEEPQPEPVEEAEPVEEPQPVEEIEPEPVEEIEPEPVEESEEEVEESEEPITGPDHELAEQAEEDEIEESKPETAKETEIIEESETTEEPKAEEVTEEEEEEQTIPIPVPKEPTVLEYDPYADVFVNPPVDTDNASSTSDSEETEDNADSTETAEVNAEPDETEEPEESIDAAKTQAEETEESIDAAETQAEEDAEVDEDDVLETPLSAAAVLARQELEDEEFSEENKSESEDENISEVEAEVEVETEVEQESEAELEAEAESEPVAEIESEPVAEPETKTEAETEPKTESEEEPPVEDQKESNEDDVLAKQITFDDILRNPFVNDFEPMNPFVEAKDEVSEEPEPDPEPEVEAEPEVEVEEEAEPETEVKPEVEAEEEAEPEPEAESEIEAEEESEPESEAEPEVEAEEEAEPETEVEPEAEVEEEAEPETEVAEAEEEAEPEAEPEEEAEPETEAAEPEAEAEEEAEPEVEPEEEIEPETEAAEPEAEAEEEAEPEPKAEPEAQPEEESEPEPVAESEVEPEEEAEPETEVEPEVESEQVNETQPEAEEPDDYAEAKAKRHEDMQNALLMAMIDDKEKTFSDAVNYMIDQDELNAKTLRSRMPIDRDILDHVIKERDYIPDKKTAIAICFALRLTWEDSVRLLYKAGYSLNDTERYDLTIEYLMRRGVYDQNMINSVLLGSGLEGFGTPQSEL